MRRLLALVAAVSLALWPGVALADQASSAEEINSGRDLVAFGSGIEVGAGQTVPRDAFCMGCNAIVAGTVGRDLVVFGGNATVSGNVGRDVIVVGGNLTLTSTASVGRDATTVGGQIHRDPGAQVGRDALSGVPISTNVAWLPLTYFLRLVITSGLFVLALLLVALFPRQVEATALLLERNPGTSFGLGCLGVIGGFALAVIFAITVILSPLSLVIGLVMFGGWMLGWTALLLLVGRRLLALGSRPSASVLAAMLVGGLLLGLLSLVPVFGILVGLVGGTVALGAALGSRFGTQPPGPPTLQGPLAPT